MPLMWKASFVLAMVGCARGEPPPRQLPDVASESPQPRVRAEAAPALGVPEEPARQPVELLHGSAAALAVSSVASSVLHPTELVDGRLETAWNSAQDDTRGAWIAFRLSADVQVTKIRMTSGFVKVEGDLDYFTANSRLAKVRVQRDGEAVGEYPLDPESRGLQDLAVSGPGGEYRIEVVDLVPGRSRRWRQTCVSELEVWGFPGRSAPARPTSPTVRVGSFAGAPSNPETGVPPAVGIAGLREGSSGGLTRGALARILQGGRFAAVQPLH
jgi:hypothetical protein